MTLGDITLILKAFFFLAVFCGLICFFTIVIWEGFYNAINKE